MCLHKAEWAASDTGWAPPISHAAGIKHCSLSVSLPLVVQIRLYM